MINTHHNATIRSFGSVHNHKEACLVSWKPPSGAAVKLNVDGSSVGNPGRSGFGGLIRDTNDNWLLGFSGSCGITTNINAELQAIFYGLEKAWSHGCRHVKSESDCQSALKLIKEWVPTTHPYAPIIDLIKRFIDYPWFLSFHHSLREDNSCADWLAKYGTSLDNSTLWNQCSAPLSTSLLADFMGITFLRV
jgi:ribonuclease HI